MIKALLAALVFSLTPLAHGAGMSGGGMSRQYYLYQSTFPMYSTAHGNWNSPDYSWAGDTMTGLWNSVPGEIGVTAHGDNVAIFAHGSGSPYYECPGQTQITSVLRAENNGHNACVLFPATSYSIWTASGIWFRTGQGGIDGPNHIRWGDGSTSTTDWRTPLVAEAQYRIAGDAAVGLATAALAAQDLAIGIDTATLDSSKVDRAGDTITGDLTVQGLTHFESSTTLHRIEWPDGSVSTTANTSVNLDNITASTMTVKNTFRLKVSTPATYTPEVDDVLMYGRETNSRDALWLFPPPGGSSKPVLKLGMSNGGEGDPWSRPSGGIISLDDTIGWTMRAQPSGYEIRAINDSGKVAARMRPDMFRLLKSTDTGEVGFQVNAIDGKAGFGKGPTAYQIDASSGIHATTATIDGTVYASTFVATGSAFVVGQSIIQNDYAVLGGSTSLNYVKWSDGSVSTSGNTGAAPDLTTYGQKKATQTWSGQNTFNNNIFKRTTSLPTVFGFGLYDTYTGDGVNPSWLIGVNNPTWILTNTPAAPLDTDSMFINGDGDIMLETGAGVHLKGSGYTVIIGTVGIMESATTANMASLKTSSSIIISAGALQFPDGSRQYGAGGGLKSTQTWSGHNTFAGWQTRFTSSVTLSYVQWADGSVTTTAWTAQNLSPYALNSGLIGETTARINADLAIGVDTATLDSTKVDRAGDTITGLLNVDGGVYTSSSIHAATITVDGTIYASTFVAVGSAFVVGQSIIQNDYAVLGGSTSLSYVTWSDGSVSTTASPGGTPPDLSGYGQKNATQTWSGENTFDTLTAFRSSTTLSYVKWPDGSVSTSAFGGAAPPGPGINISTAVIDQYVDDTYYGCFNAGFVPIVPGGVSFTASGGKSALITLDGHIRFGAPTMQVLIGLNIDGVRWDRMLYPVAGSPYKGTWLIPSPISVYTAPEILTYGTLSSVTFSHTAITDTLSAGPHTFTLSYCDGTDNDANAPMLGVQPVAYPWHMTAMEVP